MTRARTANEQRLGNEARKTLSAMRRFERRRDEAAECMEAARQDLAVLHRKACERFGREVPADAMLLDVLDLIDIEVGDRWLWRGQRNNKDLATVRLSDRRETSLVRYLAIEFGVIEDTDFGILYPVGGDTEDVNPWHRELRHSDRPVGNAPRYGFNLRDGAS